MSAEPLSREVRDLLRARSLSFVGDPEIDDDDRWIASSVLVVLDDLQAAERRAEIAERDEAKALEEIAHLQDAVTVLEDRLATARKRRDRWKETAVRHKHANAAMYERLAIAKRALGMIVSEFHEEHLPFDPVPQIALTALADLRALLKSAPE